MADLHVCATCGETEDCACSDLARARRELHLAHQEVNAKLGWLVVRLVQRMPSTCTACEGKTKRCPLCVAVESAKKTIASVLPISDPQEGR